MYPIIIEVRYAETGKLVIAKRFGSVDEALGHFVGRQLNVNLTTLSGEVVAKVENHRPYVWDKSYCEWTEWLTPEQRRVG